MFPRGSSVAKTWKHPNRAGQGMLSFTVRFNLVKIYHKFWGLSNLGP